MSSSQVATHPFKGFEQSPPQSYKCYLRTPDMRSIIHYVSTDLSVLELKAIAKRELHLNSVQNPVDIKLIVNEVQLTQNVDLSKQLFNNAIIHVITPTRLSPFESQPQTSTITLKQPPIDCPLLHLSDIDLSSKITELKSKILELYQSQYPQNQISQLIMSQLYLVYAGQILNDQKTVRDYDISENGVVYVVNGRKYVREVTREQAERRIDEVRGRQNAVDEKGQQEQQKKQQDAEIQKEQNIVQFEKEPSQVSGDLKPQQVQTMVFNIIQNIVHDEDSDVEGQTADDLTRSQKIIQRYDSYTSKNAINKDSHDDEVVIDIEEVQQTPLTETEDDYLVGGKGNSQKRIDQVVEDNELTFVERNSVLKYLDEVNDKVAEVQAKTQTPEEEQQSTPEEQSTPVVEKSLEDNNDQMLL